MSRDSRYVVWYYCKVYLFINVSLVDFHVGVKPQPSQPCEVSLVELPHRGYNHPAGLPTFPTISFTR